MKKTLTISTVLLLILYSCNHESKQTIIFEKISKFYSDTTFSELYIYPDKTYDDSLFVFKGKQIDSIHFHFLPKNVTHSLPWTEGFYGIYSFKINSNYIGLITRKPGVYDATAISLWIYDLKNDSIINNIELADIFGDAGAAQIKSSYLFLDKQNQLNVLTHTFYKCYHSVEEESDTTIEQHNYYYLTKIKFTSIDTISTDSLRLNKEFNRQLKRLASY